MTSEISISRRDFIVGSGMVAGAVALPHAAKAGPGAAGGTAGAVEMRQLGKTDLRISCVSIGTGPGQDPAVIKFARSQGINFFHTSTGYSGGKSIRNLGEAIKGERDKYVIGLKITWGPDDDRAMDAALETLGIEQADICFYNIHRADQVRNDRYRKGAERWKAAGKFRYIGLTSHGQVAQCMKEALNQGFYDALMPSYNLSMEEQCKDIFAEAAEKKVGVVLMKTGRGLHGDAYSRAVPEYLSTPAVTTINRGLKTFAAVQRMAQDSHGKNSDETRAQLCQSVELAMSGHCRMCGVCTQVCPRGLPVADVVRCSDYYMEQEEYAQFAFEQYSALGRTPSPAVCGDCHICEEACPNQVPVTHHLRRADMMLA